MNTTLRRSQLYRRHVEEGAQFEQEADSLVVVVYPNTADEQQQAAHLGLADLSTLPRAGFKGPGAPYWLEQQGAQLPETPNRAQVQDDGALIARLSHEELLILSDLSLLSSLPNSLRKYWSMDTAEKTYSLPRGDSHCWFALTGEHGAETFAKVCGVDLRAEKFADGHIAQTSLARVNAIIVRNDLGTAPCFYILSDVSSAEFLWDCLLDAMQEFEGSPVGIAALRNLVGRKYGASN